MKIAIGNRVINTLQSDGSYNRLFLCVLDDMAQKLGKENITADVFAVTATPIAMGSARCSIDETEGKVIDLLQLPLHESEEAIFKGELSIAVAAEVFGMHWIKIADLMDGIRMILIKGAPILDAFTPDMKEDD